MREIRDTLARLRAARGDAVVIEELEVQLRILQALYSAAQDLHAGGLSDPLLRADFATTPLGGAWTFENIYYFVYEQALELDPGTRELSSVVSEVDFEDLI